MSAPVLLVHDDLAVIAQVRRALAKEGYEVVLATSAADAVIAFGHHLPRVVLLGANVEGDRGRVVLEELTSRPDGALLKVIMLGPSIPGFGYPAAALPIDDADFLSLVAQTARGSGTEGDWAVQESERQVEAAPLEAAAPSDGWRATAPLAPSPGPSPTGADDLDVAQLEGALFGDLEAQVHGQVEAESQAQLESALSAQDEELRRLEEEVRAEAVRRRSRKDVASFTSAPVSVPVAQAAAPFEPAQPYSEASFADFDDAQGNDGAIESPTEEGVDASRIDSALERARLLAQSLNAQVEPDVDDQSAALHAMAERLAATEEEARRSRAAGEGLEAEVSRLRSLLASLEQQAVAHSQAAMQAQADAARAADEAEKARAAAAEAQARALAAENRQAVALHVPGRPPLGVARSGELDIHALGKLVAGVVIAGAEVRIEFATAEGVRTVWLRRGAVVAAESTVAGEALLARARADGLIDDRQRLDLRLLDNATPGEALAVLKGRGFIREEEAVPLAQRFVEAVALSAFSEEHSQYRLVEAVPGPSVLEVVATRSAMVLLAEGLRRSLPYDALLKLLGGAQAIPVALDTDLDVRELGFAVKERKLLGFIDGETSIEELVMASGLRQEVGLKALLVAKLLGVIDVKAPAFEGALAAPELDARRLEAKFEQVQEADYFSVLGLSRQSGAEEVRRAFARLAAEFDPIKYSSHPDAVVQQRAQVVYLALEEAARALEDDRRRTEYARHLLD